MAEEGIFLYVDEIENITGYVRPAAQIRWLTENGWKFTVSGKGKPVVARSFANSAEVLAVKLKVSEKSFSVSRMVNIKEQEILAGSIPAPSCAGIYFLIKESKIVYIGQSINLLSRIGNHAARIDFDKYTFIKCEKENLNDVESTLIKRFNPKHNVQHRRFTLADFPD